MRLADARQSAVIPKWSNRLGERAAAIAIWLRTAIGWQFAALLIVSVGVLIGAFQVERPVNIKVGSIHAAPFVRNFHAREVDPAGTSYRWTHETSFLIFKGFGGRARTVTLNLRTGRFDDIARPVTVFVNGVEVGRLAVGDEWQTFTFPVRGPATAGHGMAVELRTPAERLSETDPRIVGVQMKGIRIDPIGGGWTVPAWGTLGLTLLVLTVLYLLVFRALGVAIAQEVRRRLYAALAAAVGVAVIAWLFIAARPYIAVYMLSLLALLLLALAALLLPRPLMWIAARLGLAMTQGEAVGLCMILALGICMKMGGMFYGGTVISDLAWHTKWERTLLRGDFAALYFPSELSSGPSVWGAGILIPKSPLYYAFMAPFTLLPFGVDTTLKLVAGLFELTIPFFAYAFLKHVGRGSEGVVAALLYTVTPLSYLILSYGSYPTIFALFLTVLTYATMLLGWDRLGRPVMFGVIVLLLTLSLLSYPVIALFDVLTVVAFGGWCWWRADNQREQRHALLLTLGAMIAAALAFVTYYVQYVRVVLRSVHTLTRDTAKNRGYLDGGLPGVPRHIALWIANNVRVGNMLVLLIVAVAGLLILRRELADDEERRMWRFLLIWLLILPIFTLVDAYIDMILKQLFYTMIPVALFGSITVLWLWRRGRGGQVLAVLCCTAIAAQAWWLWFHRIAYGGHSGPT